MGVTDHAAEERWAQSVQMRWARRQRTSRCLRAGVTHSLQSRSLAPPYPHHHETQSTPVTGCYRLEDYSVAGVKGACPLPCVVVEVDVVVADGA